MDSVSPDEDLQARVRRLEEANAQLCEANLRLARGRLGSSEAAAASANSRIAALEEAVRIRDARIEELTEIAARNDRLYQQQVAWNDAARYRTADAVAARLRRVPGMRRLVRAARWLESRLGD